jgi:hypothetical protein
MADDVSDAPAGVANFREEAKGCFQLAKEESHQEVRTILMGMALGWLRFANHASRPQAPQLQPADVHSHDG